ncbi:hypothetical protein HN51_045227 [Arachis hypogaea]
MEDEERKAVKERVKEVKESTLKSLAKYSCTNTRIEDCRIVSGDDCVAVKSGWDEYGIKFDSCTNTRIEDCYIVSGDDCVAVKSGWDEYGIKFGMPTKQP